ncbi:MAG: heme ABC transporter ATP-binding protein [Pseudomonadota bacterium]
MLNVDDITVQLGRKTILQNMTFAARPGALTAIVGSNGSGKTTLLRAMTGDVAYQGQITLNGHDIKALEPWQLADMRAVLPQASNLAFPFTVLEVVQIGLHCSSAANATQVPMQALVRVGLKDFANRTYQELSGGEQQRVQLARVLAQVWTPVSEGAPRWLFLDEPVSALDIAHQMQVMEIAKNFAQAGGGVVAVMHDLNLTAMFADVVIILLEGRITGVGSPARVMTDAVLSQAYGCSLRVGHTPPPGTPFILPHVAKAAAE